MAGGWARKPGDELPCTAEKTTTLGLHTLTGCFSVGDNQMTGWLKPPVPAKTTSTPGRQTVALSLKQCLVESHGDRKYVAQGYLQSPKLRGV